MGTIYTSDTIGPRATERKLNPGDRLWVAGDKVAGDAYRMGNSPSNPAIYLRWRDVGAAKQGKIEGEDLQQAVINPGQGLSLFIEKVVQSDFNLLASQNVQSGKAAVAKLAEEKGYKDAHQIHWFKLDEGRVMPAGLEVVFDNDPPGHCTLTVTRSMTVHEFLHLVSDHLGFSYIGTDIFGKN
ncbi:MAG: hypothetical protein J5I93_01685 [Pirellulaceae bacterium]|nr:hypothetical protein [Pirellulaceae bacterium]